MKSQRKDIREFSKSENPDRVVVGPNDNIFEVLGRSPEEATNLLMRSQIMGELRQFIRDEEMSLRSAADFFGVSHPRISDLMKGRIDKFKIDYLLNLLVKTGKKATLHIEQPTSE